MFMIRRLEIRITELNPEPLSKTFPTIGYAHCAERVKMCS